MSINPIARNCSTLLQYSIALNEEMGHINCGAVPMSIAVQTDMATPALARYVYGSGGTPTIRPGLIVISNPTPVLTESCINLTPKARTHK